MKIVVISDTHNRHEEITIPQCDVLVHAGDFSMTGTRGEVYDFIEWLEKQPATHKLVVAGNHEMTFDDTHPRFDLSIKRMLTQRDSSIVYLENAAHTIHGIKFYGTPWTPWFYDWAFNGVTDENMPFYRGVSLSQTFSDIPEDTNVLICHGPPYNILDLSLLGDERTGSVEMRKLTSNKLTQLKLYLCGHIHEGRGVEVADGGVTFVNASSVDRSYKILYPAVVIDLDDNGGVNSVELEK